MGLEIRKETRRGFGGGELSAWVTVSVTGEELDTPGPPRRHQGAQQLFSGWEVGLFQAVEGA